MLLLALGLLSVLASAAATADNEPPVAPTPAGGGPSVPPPRPALEAADHRRQPASSTSQLPEIDVDPATTEWSHVDVAATTPAVNESLSSDAPTTATTTAVTTTTTTTRPPHVHDHVHVHSAGDTRRYGPYFEDGPGPHNVTARVGQTALLDCRVGLLQGKTVSWLHHRDDALQLLTVGRHEYSADQRITLSFRYPGNWRLRIQYVTRRDQGVYECQVATHPPRGLRVHLTVTAPDVVVTDEKGHLVSERYYKAGSAVELTCLATRLEGPEEEVVWRHGERPVTHGVSMNYTSADGSSAQSTLAIGRVDKRHSGNYTCDVGRAASTSVAVHILNGELPAAVQHNAGIGRSRVPPRYLLTLLPTLLAGDTARLLLPLLAAAVAVCS